MKPASEMSTAWPGGVPERAASWSVKSSSRRPMPPGVAGTVVAASFTRQGRPLSEFGEWRVNDAGQYLFYGKVAGCLITGNEDGIKHCAQNVLYSLQHIGYTIPPQADAGWIGEAGPGPSYLDPGSGGPENDFTNRNTTFMTWNLMHLARMLKDQGGIPVHGNQRSAWNAGAMPSAVFSLNVTSGDMRSRPSAMRRNIQSRGLARDGLRAVGHRAGCRRLALAHCADPVAATSLHS